MLWLRNYYNQFYHPSRKVQQNTPSTDEAIIPYSEEKKNLQSQNVMSHPVPVLSCWNVTTAMYVIAAFQWQSFAHLEIIKETEAKSRGLLHHVYFSQLVCLFTKYTGR